MASLDDRRAALLLLALAGVGLGVRLVTDRTAPPGAVAYRPVAVPRTPAESVAARAARVARPLAPGERVDVDRAPAEELARLPRIGPALAARIVSDRAARGPFGSLAALERVAGIGPATLEGLRPHAAFSGNPRAAWHRAAADVGRVRVNVASAAELATLPGIGPRLAAAILEDRARRGPYRRADDLLRVPGIGPTVLRRLEGRISVP
ncbi:MAG: ComEA family DNA-binding protein [Gemmatimonadota bacterium]|nr:ComEA family DNA-binding protein [Gemmatimonadota bacterium]